MCAILDTNLAGEVFKPSPDVVPGQFFKWMNSQRCRLVVGGELRRELERVGAYMAWSQQAVLTGRLRQEDDAAVDERTRELKQSNSCKSDDPHVIALAQISGARILYSQDELLGQDFRDTELLQPRGRLLPLRETKKAMRDRENLLSQRDLCPLRRSRA